MNSYWVLLLSRKPSRLFTVTGNHIAEIIEPVRDHLGIARDGFPFEDLGPQDKQYTALATGDEDARYREDHLKSFLHRVDHLFHPFIQQNGYPVIVMGVQKEVAYFEEITKHKKYIVGHVFGSYPTAGLKEILELAAPKIKEHEAQLRSDVIRQFVEAIGREHHAIGLEWVERMAHDGRVHILLVEESQKGERVHKIIETVTNKGGTVVVVAPGALKDYQHLCAILRY